MLTEKDAEQIKKHNLTIDDVVKQLTVFEQGIPFVNIVNAASIGNGVEVIPKEVESQLIKLYNTRKKELEVVKFVPASGAASRMFKFLHEFLEEFNPEEESLLKYLKKKDSKELTTFLNTTKLFPFVNEVRKFIRQNYPDYKKSNKGYRSVCFVKTMLKEDGLNYANYPKGLIPFHKYSKYSTTAFEEQLYEAAFYASVSNKVHLHFTFSKAHVPFFKKEFESIKKRVSKKTRKEFHISYSFQKKETDTIAVDQYNRPYRDDSGKLVFRPSGHGALLENLNDTNADIIFIKNIDNVVLEKYVPTIAYYKRLLAGKLLWLQKRIFSYIEKLENDDISIELFEELRSFLWNQLSIKDAPKEKLQLLYLLNRPIRVCGVVPNQGAPGGGPFWVKNEYGYSSLQIVELSQIDSNNEGNVQIIKGATHFNPVDIVCGIRDYKGNKFDLTKFKGKNAGFITQKSENGKIVKALERPGLWNSAMANWNTALIEVPIETFNPVKTVNDLLKKEHRPDA